MDDKEWPEVDRRESERRDPGPPQHVTVDGMSNGAATTVARVEQKFDQAIAVGGKLLKLGLGLIGSVLLGMFSLGVWYHKVNTRIDARPTMQVTQEMVEDATRDALRTYMDELAKNGAADQIRSDATTKGLAELQLTMEAFGAEMQSLRRDVDRIDRTIQ